jgi:site-specific recombinase XerC
MQTADVIAEYLDAAARGRVRDADGQPYGRDAQRALRGALSHVASDELGIWEVQDVRDEDIRALVARLREAGVPGPRVDAVAPALRSLYAYAIGEGLVTVNPVTVPPPAPAPAPAPRAADPAPVLSPTPTTAMLAVTEHALTWTVRMIVVASLLAVAALFIALS